MEAGPSQPITAEQIYDARSSKYDESWHPRFASHIVQLAKPALGEHVLDLACGTGLVSLLASQAVGSEGQVIGVDISKGMLSEARRKLQNKINEGKPNVQFLKGDITALQNLEEVEKLKGSIDLITCASALVLVPDPAAAIEEWTRYLAPGGRLIVDVTHPRSQIAGICMERVGESLGRPIPHFRLNFEHEERLIRVLKEAGLRDVQFWRLSQLDIEGASENVDDYIFDPQQPRVEREYDVDDADEVFEAALAKSNTYEFLKAERAFAKLPFRGEWGKFADEDRKVKSLDCVWVAMGWK